MNPATVQLILTLIPLAEKLIFDLGGKLLELNTKELTKEDLIAALQESRSENWPDLKFSSPVKDNG